jgi:hypothetical protein
MRAINTGLAKSRLQAATLDEPDDDNNHHDDQDNVNQASEMKNGESEEPQDEQDYSDSPKHNWDRIFRTAIGASSLFSDWRVKEI